MNINRLIALLVVLLIGLTGFGLFNSIALLVSIGHIFVLPMIGIWYGFKRHWRTTSIDIAMYLTYLVGSFSDSLILLGGQIGEVLQITMTIVMHMILIVIFRKEGTRIYSDKLQDLPKLLIPITIIFIFFGTVLIPVIPDALYFLLIFYAVQEMILISHGLFRRVKGKSYVWVALGVSLIFLKDVLYCYNFFIYENSILSLYIIQYSLSAFVYFMIAVGIALNQDNNSLNQQESFEQFIKNYVKVLFNIKNLIHFQKILETIKNIFDEITKSTKRNFSIFWHVLAETNKIF